MNLLLLTPTALASFIDGMASLPQTAVRHLRYGHTEEVANARLRARSIIGVLRIGRAYYEHGCFNTG